VLEHLYTLGQTLGGIATAEGYALNIAAFMPGLKEGGFIEGQNVVIEQRWANYRYDRLPEMAAEFVRQPVAMPCMECASTAGPRDSWSRVTGIASCARAG